MIATPQAILVSRSLADSKGPTRAVDHDAQPAGFQDGTGPAASPTSKPNLPSNEQTAHHRTRPKVVAEFPS